MKIVGMMCVKDEADLLPEVYPHINGLVDELFVYDDGSQDGTWDIVKNASYAIRKNQDTNRQQIHRPNYHHLLEKIKQEFNYKKEEIWVVITMGDRFFLNKTPKQIVTEAGDFPAVEGIQLDFLRHRLDPWTEENDTYPIWPTSLRQTCRWFKFDERCIVAYKVNDQISYLQSKYPWPRSVGIPKYGYTAMEGKLSIDMPFLEHQGRRSPKACMWRHSSGSRPLGKKNQHLDISSFEAVKTNIPQFYDPYKIFPWIDLDSLNTLIEWYNLDEFRDNRINQKWFFKGAEMLMSKSKLPPRKDLI